MTAKAAGTDEAEAERGQAGAAEVVVEAGAPVGAAAGAEREARKGPAREGAKSAESAKKVTRGGGS